MCYSSKIHSKLPNFRVKSEKMELEWVQLKAKNGNDKCDLVISECGVVGCGKSGGESGNISHMIVFQKRF